MQAPLDSLTHGVMSGAILATIAGGLKVWADQRSDQRAARHEKQNRLEVDRVMNERLERLEIRTEAAIRLEGEVSFVKKALDNLATATEDLRKTVTDSHGVLQRLLGRAEQADNDYARRRRTDT